MYELTQNTTNTTTNENPKRLHKRSNSSVEGLPPILDNFSGMKHKCRTCNCENFIPKPLFPWICLNCSHTSIKHDIDKRILSPRT